MHCPTPFEAAVRFRMPLLRYWPAFVQAVGGGLRIVGCKILGMAYSGPFPKMMGINIDPNIL